MTIESANLKQDLQILFQAVQNVYLDCIQIAKITYADIVTQPKSQEVLGIAQQFRENIAHKISSVNWQPLANFQHNLVDNSRHYLEKIDQKVDLQQIWHSIENAVSPLQETVRNFLHNL